MTQNPDCMRDVLTEIEALQGFGMNGVLEPLYSDALLASELREVYTEADILYSVKQLAGSGMLDAQEKRAIRQMSYTIADITPSGHTFLQNTRNAGVWAETKARAGKIGSFALDVLSQIAAAVIAARISG